MVVKATSTITCLLLSFLAIQTSKAEGDLLWTSFSEIQPSVDSNIKEHVFIESGSHSGLSEMFTNFINRLDFNENIDNTASLKNIPSLNSKFLCQNLYSAFPKTQHQTFYIFQGSSSESAIIYNCDKSFSLIIIEVNPEVLSLKPLEKQAKIWQSIFKGSDLRTLTIDIGSVCQKELHFDKKMGKCVHQMRKLTIEEDYEEFKNNQGVEAAISILGFEELNADLLELMFNDLLDTILRPVSAEYFEVFVSDVSILMGTIHHEYTSEELMEPMYGYLWTDMTSDDEVPLDSSLSFILDQSSLYLDYYDYLDTSFSKVDSLLSSFFSYYAYYSLYIGMQINAISDAYDLVINVQKSKLLYEEQTTFESVVGSRSYLISTCDHFLTNEAWSVFVIDYSYIENVNQHFSVHLYMSGASDTEIDSEYTDFEDEERFGSANRFLMTVELSKTFDSASRIYCKGQPCIVSDENPDLDTVALSFGTTGHVEVVPYSCEGDSIYLAEYIEYRDLDGPELAISIYSLIEDAEQCFLLQMWDDLKDVLSSYDADSDQFAFFNGAVINLMDPMHFESLTEGMMNDMLGYSWVISTYVPDYIYPEVCTSVADQLTFYIEYFEYSEESFEYVDKAISRYFMFYSDKEMLLGLDIKEFFSTESLTSTSIKAEIVKIYGSDLNGYNIGGGTYASVGLFEDDDIVSVFNIAYKNTKFAADVISVHLYYAGNYNDEDQGEGYKQEEIGFVDTSFSISFVSEDIILCIKEDCEDSENSENSEITITVKKEGIYYFMKDCGDSNWNREKLYCEVVCEEGLFVTEDNTCEPCGVENCDECLEHLVCDKCTDNYFITEDYSCETCDIDKCVTCANIEECEICDDNYFLIEDNTCEKCSLSNCEVCLSLTACEECSENYFLTSDLKCKTCSVSNCKECSKYSECKTCNSGYYLKADYQCDTCSIPCIECKDSKDKCTKCGALTSLASDKCTCIANASFDDNKIDCNCKSDYTLIGEGTNAVCQSCKRYISENNLLSAAYSEDMKFLYVSFNVSIESSSKCSDLVTNYLSLGTDAKCEVITNNKQIKINLGSNWSILNGPIILNSEKIIHKSKTATCSITAPYLNKTITHDSSITTPTAVLFGSTNFYGECSDSSDSIFSAKDTYDITGLGLNYTWTFTNLTKFSKFESLTIYLSSQKSSKLEIDIQNYFGTYNGGLYLTVNISNAFNEWSTKSLLLTFQSTSGLTMSIEGGNIYEGYVDSRLEFKAVVEESCGAKGEITYKWKRVDNGDYSEKLDNLESGKKLVLKKGVLEAGNFYNFTVVASRGGIDGTAYVEIYSLSRELEVILDAPQKLPAGKNLKVSAKRSKDPNDDDAEMKFKWSCEKNGKECSDKLTEILSEEKSSEIEIDKDDLPTGTITIIVKVFSGSLNKTAQVDVEISDKIKTVTNIYGPPGRVSRSRDCKITSNIELSGKKKNDMFKWTIPSGLSIKSTNDPFLYITAGTFTSSTDSYQFILTVNDEEVYTITIEITANYPPLCTGAKISPDSGYALFTEFLLEATCEDPEEDYPLAAIAGFNLEGHEMGTGHKGNGREKSSRFSSGDIEVYLLVCDTMGDCFKATFELNVKIKKRMLGIEDEYMALFEDIKSEDSDAIPGTITIIANTYSINITNLEYFLHNLIEYDSNQTSRDIDLLHLELAAIMSLVNDNQIPNIILAFLEELYSFTYDILIEFSKSFSFQSETLSYVTNIADSIRSYDSSNMELLEMSKNLTSLGVSLYMVDKLPLFEYVEENEAYYSFTKRYKLDEILNIGIPPNKTIAEFKEVGGYRDSEEDSDTEHLFDVITSIYYDGGDYSSPIETTIRPAGVIINFTYYPEENNTDPITEFEDSILLYIQVTENATLEFECGYLDGGNIITDGCKILEISDDLIATIEVNHLSVYIIIEPEPLSSSEDENDYAPFIILLIVFFIELISLPYAMMADNIYTKQLTSSINEDQGFTKTFEGNPASPAGSERPLTSFASSLPDIEDISDDNIDQNKDSEFTIMFVLKPYGVSEKKILRVKGWFENMLEGHLLFGLIFYRPKFTRALRIITIFTTVILHLLLEGLFYYHSYDYESGKPRSTQNLFDTYEEDYFAFALVSLAIALPVEVFLIAVFSHERAKYVVLHLFALVLALLITIGSFIGVFILTFMFDFQWNGYWAVSFLWSILIELFFLQAIYMFTRYFIFREKEDIKATKNR